MLRRRRRSAEELEDPPDSTFADLRALALHAVARGLVAPSHDHPDVSGVVVDVPSEGGYATIVALTDNTTSMYTSTGGGTIGAGAHAEVAAATRVLLLETQRNLGAFKAKDTDELPQAGFVRFHVLAPSAGRYADVSENVFWGREGHELTPVIVATQNVITAIRTASST